MLPDPENFKDQSFQVYARSLEEARVRSEKEVAKLTQDGTPAQSLGCHQMTFSRPPFRFVCIIRIEQQGEPDDND
jgi:hypothetical protein